MKYLKHYKIFEKLSKEDVENSIEDVAYMIMDIIDSYHIMQIENDINLPETLSIDDSKVNTW
jgi:hypothetical protein